MSTSLTPNEYPEVYGLKTLSIAGDYSFYYFQSWKILMDCGLFHPCYSDLRSIILTHAHMDHFGALFQILSRNDFLHRPPLKVYGPGWIYPVFERLRTSYEFLNDSSGWNAEWISFEDDQEIELGNRRVLRVRKVDHRQPAYCLQIFERRTCLKDELRGLPSEKIKSLRKEGHPVQREILHPLLCYSGDSNRSILSYEELDTFETLLLECTFLQDGFEERAFRYGHIHFQDILNQIKRFEHTKNLILTHFSARTTPQQFQQAFSKLRERLPASVNLIFNHK